MGPSASPSTQALTFPLLPRLQCDNMPCPNPYCILLVCNKGDMGTMRRIHPPLPQVAEIRKKRPSILEGLYSVIPALSLIAVVLTSCEEPKREAVTPEEAASQIAGSWRGTFNFDRFGIYAVDMTITAEPKGRLSGTGHINHRKCPKFRFSGYFEAPEASLVAQAVDVSSDAPAACLEDLVLTLTVQKDETGQFFLVGGGDLGDSTLTAELERSPKS